MPHGESSTVRLFVYIGSVTDSHGYYYQEQLPEHHHNDPVLFPTSADEFIPLMHYLDDVFPLQNPMSKPSTLTGGRGRLLALLLRMKPLYHATLAVPPPKGCHYR